MTALGCLGAGAPHVLHYAWKLAVSEQAWAFNKHDHNSFLYDSCSPWDDGRPGARVGLLPHPPLPRLLHSQVLSLLAPEDYCAHPCLFWLARRARPVPPPALAALLQSQVLIHTPSYPTECRALSRGVCSRTWVVTL